MICDEQTQARIRWTGDSLARLIWVCEDCGATGSGEDQPGIDAGNAHRTACTGAALPTTSDGFRVVARCVHCGCFLTLVRDYRGRLDLAHVPSLSWACENDEWKDRK